MPSAKLGFGAYDNYTPAELLSRPINDLRHEYARLRKIANADIAELLGSEYADEDYIQQYAGRFAYSNRATKSDLAYRLVELVGFLQDQRSTVEGFAEYDANLKAIFERATGREISNASAVSLRRFLDELRELGVFKTYDSGQAVAWFDDNFSDYPSPEEAAQAFYDQVFMGYAAEREAKL